MILQTQFSMLWFLFLMTDGTNALLSQRSANSETTRSTTTAAAESSPRHSVECFYSSSSANEDDEIYQPLQGAKKNATSTAPTNSETEASSSALSQALLLQQQAQKLRNEANAQAKALQEEQDNKLALQNSKIDSWIEDLLIQYQVDDDTQLLHSVDQVLCRLRDDRYSHEQVNKIFKRICETGPPQSRSRCSPIMELFVDAVGKLDEVERAENPNKRWSGKAERELRKKLFAMDWGIDLPDEDDEGNPWKL